VALTTAAEVSEYNNMRMKIVGCAMKVFRQEIKADFQRNVHVFFFHVLGDESSKLLCEGLRRCPITNDESKQDLLLKIIGGGNVSSLGFLLEKCQYPWEELPVFQIFSHAITSCRCVMLRYVYIRVITGCSPDNIAFCRATLRMVIREIESDSEIGFIYSKTINAAKKILSTC
jgi:hypothetical protein